MVLPPLLISAGAFLIGLVRTVITVDNRVRETVTIVDRRTGETITTIDTRVGEIVNTVDLLARYALDTTDTRVKETVHTTERLAKYTLDHIFILGQMTIAIAFLVVMYALGGGGKDFDSFIEITSQISTVLLLTTSLYSIYRDIQPIFLLHLFFLSITLVRLVWEAKSMILPNIRFDEFISIKSCLWALFVYSPIIAAFVKSQMKEGGYDHTDKYHLMKTLLNYPERDPSVAASTTNKTTRVLFNLIVVYPSIKLALMVNYFDNTFQAINMLLALFMWLIIVREIQTSVYYMIDDFLLNYCVSVCFGCIIQATVGVGVVAAAWIPFAELFCFSFHLLWLSNNDTFIRSIKLLVSSSFILGFIFSSCLAVGFIFRLLSLLLTFSYNQEVL